MKDAKKKKLSALIDRQSSTVVHGDVDLKITTITDDSRRVTAGGLFVALRGRTVDGHRFAAAAVKNGAAAVMVDHLLQLPVGVTQIVCPDTTVGFARVAARFYENPAERLKMVAVTGTNGKTTTCYLLEAILRQWGKRPGVLGTVSYRYGAETFSAPYTTPTPMVLHATLREMVEAGCDHALLEVSSHALEMQRVAGLSFRVAGFTNLTQDHLDLHGDMERYFAAKQRLFNTYLDEAGTAVAWLDDPRAVEMLAGFGGKKLFCSATTPDADVCLVSQSLDLRGLSAQIRTPRATFDVRSPLLGATNVANILVATGMAEALGVPVDSIQRGIERCEVVPGRLERVDRSGDASGAVLVDYAHTPDAIRQVLATLRPLCHGRLMIVFGCGGDRDKTKRAVMGAAAGGGADVVIVTSDNPRTEDPLAIIEMAAEGVVESGKREIAPDALADAPAGYVVLPDRRTAIANAVAACGPQDVLLIAGKGHEDYQILGTHKIHFDDREEARRGLDAMARRNAPSQEGGGKR
jgi:UDP-N-acetylmuramyl-tripeptide synthetase